MKIKKASKKMTITIVSVVAVGCLVYGAAAWMYHLPPFTNAKDKGYQPGEYVVNMDRSESEKRETEALKDDPSKKGEPQQNDRPATPPVDKSTGKATVNVLITNTGIFNNIVSASGMVTDIAQGDGTCTYVFTNGESVVTKTSSSLANPTSTTCATVSFDASELPISGVWSVKLKYTSSTAVGESNSKEFTK